MTRLILTIALFALTACVAPDGQTYTLTTAADAEQEFYRGVWGMCLYVMMAQHGDADLAGCTELTAHALEYEMHLDTELIELWDWDLLRKH